MKRRSLQKAIKETLKLNVSQNNILIKPGGGNSQSPKKKKMNRTSAQRITLFKYPQVEVSNGVGEISNNMNNFLLARGPFEIYEIRTVSSRSFYLCVGRHGDIIHPLLPKLRVRRLPGAEFKVLISFSNPVRFWEVKFIDRGKDTKNDANITNKNIDIDSTTINDFESVISNICQYSKEPIDIERRSEENEQSVDDVETGQVSDACLEDELNYLLEEDTDVEEEDSKEKINDSSNAIRKVTTEEEEGKYDDEEVNQAFKKALNNVVPSWYRRNENENYLRDHKHSQNFKRTSLYIPKRTTIKAQYDGENHLSKFYNNRRSISVFSDYETLISLDSLKL